MPYLGYLIFNLSMTFSFNQRLRQQEISAEINSTKQESDIFDCFPNPFQSTLNINIPNKKGSAYSLCVRSMIGQELFKLSDIVESNGYV